jgi:hypothetical protein
VLWIRSLARELHAISGLFDRFGRAYSLRGIQLGRSVELLFLRFLCSRPNAGTGGDCGRGGRHDTIRYGSSIQIFLPYSKPHMAIARALYIITM